MYVLKITYFAFWISKTFKKKKKQIERGWKITVKRGHLQRIYLPSPLLTEDASKGCFQLRYLKFGICFPT